MDRYVVSVNCIVVIRDVYPGSRVLILSFPDHESRILDPITVTKEEGENFFVLHCFVATCFSKVKNILFFNRYRKNLSHWQRFIVLFKFLPQNCNWLVDGLLGLFWLIDGLFIVSDSLHMLDLGNDSDVGEETEADGHPDDAERWVFLHVEELLRIVDFGRIFYLIPAAIWTILLCI